MIITLLASRSILLGQQLPKFTFEENPIAAHPNTVTRVSIEKLKFLCKPSITSNMSFFDSNIFVFSRFSPISTFTHCISGYSYAQIGYASIGLMIL